MSVIEENLLRASEAMDIECALDTMQTKVNVWSDHNFGDTRGIEAASNCLLGVMEEGGELCHAILKSKQGIRGTQEEHEAAAKDAIGDMLIYLFNLCGKMDWRMSDCLLDAWMEVSERDWKKFPKNGVSE
jgi:NTP pyrophosphatase (non-canonical NTP hydrolase)